MELIVSYFQDKHAPPVEVSALRDRLENSAFIEKKVGGIDQTVVQVPYPKKDSSRFPFNVLICNRDSCLVYKGCYSKSTPNRVSILDSSQMIAVKSVDTLSFIE
jgi:hypothetical protein